MLIDEKALKHWIDNFYGYGSWNSRFWFIAYEENGGDLPAEVADKVNYFQNLPTQPEGTICDIRELYKHVTIRSDTPKSNSFDNLYAYRFEDNAVQNNVWKNLTAFVHGYRHEQLPDLLSYQQVSFASPLLSTEAMIPLYPLPSPHNHAWYYSWLDMPQLTFLKSRSLYQQELYERRINSILSNIKKYKPEVVLMYGMENINSIKRSVQEAFQATKFKVVKATAHKIPQHHIAKLDGTILLITTQIPALKHNRVETGFDWEEFGKVISAR